MHHGQPAGRDELHLHDQLQEQRDQDQNEQRNQKGNHIQASFTPAGAGSADTTACEAESGAAAAAAAEAAGEVDNNPLTLMPNPSSKRCMKSTIAAGPRLTALLKPSSSLSTRYSST